MREFDPTQELAAQLEIGSVRICDVRSIAIRIADFHHQAEAAPPDSPLGDVDSVRDQIVDNQTVLERHAGATDDMAALRRLGDWLQRSLDESAPLIGQRKRSGAVRECHGDLHAHNIVRWGQRWTPFDCIEFNPDLRWIDVVSDVAFLFMDLVAHRRPDLAYAFLSRYLEDTGDYQGLPLLRLYAVYRAAVRAKVDALAERVASANEAPALRARRVRRLEVAAELMTGQAPAMLLTHGVTACGKSWLSERLVHGLPAVRVRSDLERKRLAGIEPLGYSGSGVGEKLYAPAFTDRLYARLLECAYAALAAGLKVIVDASFLRFAHREQFRQAAIRQGVPFVILSCHAGSATLHRRLDDRMRAGFDPSEANRAVLDHQLATQEPFTPDEQPHVLRVDTEALTAIDEVVDAIAATTNRGSRENEKP
jgi:predicted kinase